MKTLVKQVKKLKKASMGISILGVVILIASTVFVACHQDENVKLQKKDIGHTVEVINDLVIFDLENDNGAYVNLVYSARVFYIPSTLEKYEYYVRIVKDAFDKKQILKFFIGRQEKDKPGYPIIKIEYLDKKDQERVIKRNGYEEIIYETTSKNLETRSSNSLSSTMSLGKAKSFFEKFENKSCEYSWNSIVCIPFQYATDGCYARAHYMRKMMADEGYDCKKIFAYMQGSIPLSANTKAYCCVEWGWHVAPMVIVENGYSSQEMVLDPSLFSGPVSRSTWVNKLKEDCKGSGIPQIQEVVKPSKVYIRLKNGYTIYDNNYSKTMATMSGYSNLSGCN